MASSKVKGIQIEIGGNTTKLGKALEDVEKTSKNLQSELKGVNSLLKMDPSNTVLLTQKQEILKETIGETSEKLKLLKETEKQVQEQFKKGDISREQYRDFQREIIATEQRLKMLKDEFNDFASVAGKKIELAGKSVQNFGKKIQDSASNIESWSKKFAPLSATATASLGVAITTASSLEDATKKYLASTGKATTESEKYQKVLQSIHDNNYGEDYADIADKMRIVSNLMGDMPDDELQSIVEKSYMLQDAYDMDFQETLRGINNLMYQYGLTSEDAFNLFTKGAQEGLNFSGELGDNIAEYVGNFKEAGYSADEYFQLLKNGSDNGAYNLDKVNDAINEATIRLSDGTIEDNLNVFSNETKKLFKEWQNGDASQKEVIERIIQDIKECTNEQEALTMASTLFGTMGEDSNLDFIKSLSSVGDEFKNVSNVAEEASETMYDGTSSKAKEAVRSIKSSLSGLGKSLLPIIAKIADSISKVAKQFNELDDNTKDFIATGIILVATITPLINLTAKLTSSVGKIVTNVGKFVETGGKLITKLKAMTTAQELNNKTVLNNPYILAATAIGTLTTAIGLWLTKTDEKTQQMKEETEKVKEQTDAVLEEAKAYRDSVKAREDSLEQNLQELDYYGKLYDELQQIVDQNGVVKEGYESRAKFITDVLADALGIEIGLVDNQIQGYQELTQTFDDVIEKKKAMLILESQEEAYTEAIQKKSEAEKKANDAYSKMLDARAEKQRLQQELDDAYWVWDKNRIKSQIKEIDKQYSEYETQYRNHQSTYESYLNTIGMYETNYQLAHEEKYDQMIETEEQYLVKQAELGKLSETEMMKMIFSTKNYLDELYKLKKESNSDIYDEQISAQEQQLESLQEALKNQKIAVNVGNSNITEEWLTGIANQLNAISGKQYEFKKLADGTVQMYIDGVAEKTPIAEKNMEEFANKLIAQLQKRPQARTAGENLIDGVNEGINNSEKQNKAKSSLQAFGATLLSTFQSSLKEHSPSEATEEMGKFLDEGVILGVENNKKKALRTVSRFGTDILNKMQESVNSNINTPDFKKNILLEASTNFTNSSYHQQQANKISDLAKILNTYMPEIIDHMDRCIVLDDNTLVGKIASKMDNQLGAIRAKKQRGY